MIYFTSDTHFFHFNILKYTARNTIFGSIEEMNESFIERWNSAVKESDIVWHLGDFAFGSFDKAEAIFKRLNGTKHLVLGNHDKDERIWRLFKSVQPYKEIKVGNQKIILCHYAFRVWNSSHHGSYCLFGHSHGTLEGQGLSFDVGVDCPEWNYTPVSYEQIEAKMKTLTPVYLDGHKPEKHR